METNSYQRLKDFVFTNLQKTKGALHETQIIGEISNTRKLIEHVSIGMFAQFLPDKGPLTPLTDDDWARMMKELELYFDVKMEKGILIKGVEQQTRDSSWWTGVEKQRAEKYYWSRFKTYIETSLSPEVVKTIDIDTDVVMDNIENPSYELFDRYGMVVGHVQSGKTANYSALICKAADAGYKFIVVVAGGLNNLRNQTQIRINEAFIGQNKGVTVGVGTLGGAKKELMPLSLTTAEQDFNNRDADRNAQGLNFDNIRTPVILVIKKNTNTLANVIAWLEAQYRNQISKHAVLMIDDESDYASINTKEEEDPTTINKRLRKLLSLFQKSAYVAFTATPYANIFIDHEAGHDDIGRDLFPKDFIYALDTPSNYFGARKVFLDPIRKHIVEVDDYQGMFPVNHKKEFIIPALPASLYEAIRLFILNIAIRNIRGQGNAHNSMLVHATRFTKIHQQIGIYIQNYVDLLVKELLAYGMLKNPEAQSKVIQDLKETLVLRHPQIEFEWDMILSSACQIARTVVVREVHQSKVIQLEYRSDRNTNAIVIGGASLSRGFTLEGLSVSYFLRNTVFYDTLMQMGRWFGYRPGYEDLCKIYIPKAMIENFGLIIEATEDLIDDFKRMALYNMTPNDFGLSIRHHPESFMQITARNKHKSATDIYFDMKLDGHIKETAYLLRDENIIRENLATIHNIVSELRNDPSCKYELVDKVHLWRYADKKKVLEFINKFKIYQTDPFGLRSRMPIDFIKKYVADVDTMWDVILYSGFGDEIIVAGLPINREKRKVEIQDNYILISHKAVGSGNAEFVALAPADREVINSSMRKDIRAKLERPLLMLHILQAQDKDGLREFELGAYGVSFPGGIQSGANNIRIKINTVQLKYLQESLSREQDNDD